MHCVHEYKNLDNVHSGERSQEITFDFISAEAGIAKQAQTIPGHRYQIEAWGKHVRSQSPVELSLGVDLSGGENWPAAPARKPSSVVGEGSNCMPAPRAWRPGDGTGSWAPWFPRMASRFSTNAQLGSYCPTLPSTIPAGAIGGMDDGRTTTDDGRMGAESGAAG